MKVLKYLSYKFGVRISAIHFTGLGLPVESYSIIPYLYNSFRLRDFVTHELLILPSSVDISMSAF
jgi:hypothetical protein|nr:MAG TPA: hypothetical protein [Caudoviricetes sp.]